MSLRMLQQHQHAHPIPENDYRARFVRFYEKYNPEKLRDVDDLMQRYSYDLPGVISAMVDKYGPEPGPVGPPKKVPTAAPQQQPSTPAHQQQQQQQSSAFAARPAGATVVVQPQQQQPVQVVHAPQQGSTIGNRPIPENDYRARIVRYYQRYNPEKLSEVDALMQRYSHDLPAVMTAMQKKYGPEPGPVTPAGAPAAAAVVSAPQTPLVKVVHRPSTSIVSQDGTSPPNVVRVVHRPAPSTVSDHPGSSNTNAAATPLTPHGSVRIVHQATPSNVGQRAIPEHDYRARIVRYYQRYNPEKIAEVDALMQRYSHDLPGVMTAMQKKYGPEPGPVVAAAAGGGSVPPSPGLPTGATPPPPTVGPNVKVVHRSVLSSDATSGMRPPATAASAPGTAAGLAAALAAAGSNAAGQVQPPQQPVIVQQQRAAPPATAGTTSAGASSSSLQPRRGGFDLEKLRIRGSSSDDDDDDSVSTVLRHPPVPDTPAAAAAPSQQASPVRGTSSVQSSFASATNAAAALLQNNNNSSSQFSDGANKAAGNRSAPASPTRALSMRTDSDADVMQRESTDGPHRETTTTTTTKPTPSGSPTKTKAEAASKPLSRNDSSRMSQAGDASGTAASSRAPSSHAEGGGRSSPKKSTAASSATASPTKHQQHPQHPEQHHHTAPTSASTKPASPTKKSTTGGDTVTPASPTKHDPSHSSSYTAAHQHQPQQQQHAAPKSILKGTTETPRATAPPSTEAPPQPQQHQASAPSSKANARKAAAERALAQRRPWVESTKVAQQPPRRWQSQLDEAVSSDDTDQGHGNSKAQQRSGTPPPQRGRTTTPVNRNVTPADQPVVSGAAAATRRTDSAAARRAEYDDHVRRSHSATSATMERQSSRTHSPLTVSSTATGGDDTKRGPRRWVSPAVQRQEQAAEERRMRELRANAIQRYTALVKAGLEDSDLAFVTRQEAMREAHVDPTTFTSPRRTATNHSGNVSRQSFASPESVQFVSDGEDDDGNDNDDATDRVHVEIVQHASARRTNAAVTRLMEERETFSFRPNIANPPELREVLGVPRGRERCGVKIGVAVDRHSYIPRTDHTHGDDGFFTAPIVRSSSSSSGPGFNELLVPYDVYSTFKKDTRPSAWALATPPPSMVNKPPHAKKATVMAPVENDPFLPPGVPPVYVSDKPRTEEERAKQAALVHRLSLNKRAQQTLRSHSAEARVIAEQRTQQRRPSPMGRPR